VTAHPSIEACQFPHACINGLPWPGHEPGLVSPDDARATRAARRSGAWASNARETSRASIPTPAASSPQATAPASGPCASSPASAPPTTPTAASSTSSRRPRPPPRPTPASPPPSTSPPSWAATATMNSPSARSASAASPSTPSRTCTASTPTSPSIRSPSRRPSTAPPPSSGPCTSPCPPARHLLVHPRRHPPERHPQRVPLPERVHLPARALRQARRRHHRVPEPPRPQVELRLHLRLPHPRGRQHRDTRNSPSPSATAWNTSRPASSAAWTSTFAPRLSFFFNSHNEFFEEICKLRAARRIWARAMKHRYGAKSERSWYMKTHVQTAGCSLTEQQPLNNIVRVAYQAMAAVLGGCQSLHTDSMDETLGLPTEQAVTVALRTQQILAHETGVTRVTDPLGGSWFIEQLTDTMEAEALDSSPRSIAWASGRRRQARARAPNPTRAIRLLAQAELRRRVVHRGINKGYFRRQIAEASYRFSEECEATTASSSASTRTRTRTKAAPSTSFHLARSRSRAGQDARGLQSQARQGQGRRGARQHPPRLPGQGMVEPLRQPPLERHQGRLGRCQAARDQRHAHARRGRTVQLHARRNGAGDGRCVWPLHRRAGVVVKTLARASGSQRQRADAR
jgi:hypothetical protein